MGIPLLDMAQGATKIATTWMDRKDRQKEFKQSEAEYNRTKADYQNQDTSNPYANVTNTYEDLGVNTQQADYVSQQQQQGLSNTMSNLQGAAGGGGIASLAQAMAGQQSQNLQAASASIGAQESANERASAGGAATAQQWQAKGEMASRTMERDQKSTLLGMGQARFGAAKDAKAAATQAYASGIGDIAGGVIGAGIGFGLQTENGVPGVLGTAENGDKVSPVLAALLGQ